MKAQISTLFVDIGGVLLTNGWDHTARLKVARTFSLDFEEFEERHRALFDLFETGKISLKEYLDHTVFYKKQSFSRKAFQDSMLAQSKPYTDMIKLIKEIKNRYGLRIVAVSNEGLELMEYRIKKFALRSFIDVCIASCFVHLKKPDKDIWKLALTTSGAAPQEVFYIEDRPLFVEIAASLGIRGHVHTHYKSTKVKLEKILKG